MRAGQQKSEIFIIFEDAVNSSKFQVKKAQSLA